MNEPCKGIEISQDLRNLLAHIEKPFGDDLMGKFKIQWLASARTLTKAAKMAQLSECERFDAWRERVTVQLQVFATKPSEDLESNGQVPASTMRGLVVRDKVWEVIENVLSDDFGSADKAVGKSLSSNGSSRLLILGQVMNELSIIHEKEFKEFQRDFHPLLQGVTRI